MSLRQAVRAFALGLLAAGTVVWPGSAASHEPGTGGYAAGWFHTSITVVPELPRLNVRVLEGRVPGLYVENDTGETLEVLDDDGRPFLRIGPRDVHGDTASPAYQIASGREAARRSTGVPQDDAAWTKLSDEPTWSWLEYRGHVTGRGESPMDLGGSVTVHRWRTPLQLGEQAIDVRGAVQWIPAPRVTGPGGPADLPLGPFFGIFVGLVALLSLGRYVAGHLGQASTDTSPESRRPGPTPRV